MSGAVALLTLLPMRAQSFDSDGAQILQVLGHSPEAFRAAPAAAPHARCSNWPRPAKPATRWRLARNWMR